jgi:hypothetical protein
VVASERDRPDVAHRRAQWHKYQDRVEPERLVFIDETWTRTNMTPLRGWAPRGLRLQAKAPHGHWKTTTFLAALRHNRIEAPWLFAEFERGIIRERVNAGLARARANGVKLGRRRVKPSVEARILELRAKGDGILKIGRTLGVGTSVVQRVFKEMPWQS